jgi:hypothetical protein
MSVWKIGLRRVFRVFPQEAVGFVLGSLLPDHQPAKIHFEENS